MPGNIPGVLAAIQPAVETARKKGGDVILNAAKIHALMLARRLFESPIISGAVKEGKTKIIPAIYDLYTGVVDLL